MKIISVEYFDRDMKFSLWEMESTELLVSGFFNRIGSEDGSYTVLFKNEKISENVVLNDYDDVTSYLVDLLIQLDFIYSASDIKGIGHKLSQVYSQLSNDIIFSQDSLSKLKLLDESSSKFEILGVQSFMNKFPESLNIGLFDYSFFQTMKKSQFLFPVPYQWYEKYGIRKYGVDGITHEYICSKISDLLHDNSFKLVSCSLGDSNSICSIYNGKAVDISSGFLNSSGIVSCTSSGSIDPAIIPYIMECEGKNAGEVIDDLNNVSGILGLSELSDNINNILESTENDDKSSLALDKYIMDIVYEISKSYVLLEGIDVLVFTSKIGENSISIRRKISEKLSCLGVKIDLDANNVCEKIQKISSDDSKILVYVIPSDDSLAIAKKAYNMING